MAKNIETLLQKFTDDLETEIRERLLASLEKCLPQYSVTPKTATEPYYAVKREEAPTPPVPNLVTAVAPLPVVGPPFTRVQLLDAYRAAGTVAGAAKALGLPRTTYYNYCSRVGIAFNRR